MFCFQQWSTLTRILQLALRGFTPLIRTGVLGFYIVILGVFCECGMMNTKTTIYGHILVGLKKLGVINTKYCDLVEISILGIEK